jgi:hypothetical protein
MLDLDELPIRPVFWRVSATPTFFENDANDTKKHPPSGKVGASYIKRDRLLSIFTHSDTSVYQR